MKKAVEHGEENELGNVHGHVADTHVLDMLLEEFACGDDPEWGE